MSCVQQTGSTASVRGQDPVGDVLLVCTPGDEGESDSEGGMSDDEDEQLAIERHNKLLEKARSVAPISRQGFGVASIEGQQQQRGCARMVVLCTLVRARGCAPSSSSAGSADCAGYNARVNNISAQRLVNEAPAGEHELEGKIAVIVPSLTSPLPSYRRKAMADADAETRAMATNIRTGDESDDDIMAADEDGAAAMIGTAAGEGQQDQTVTMFVDVHYHSHDTGSSEGLGCCRAQITLGIFRWTPARWMHRLLLSRCVSVLCSWS